MALAYPEERGQATVAVHVPKTVRFEPQVQAVPKIRSRWPVGLSCSERGLRYGAGV